MTTFSTRAKRASALASRLSLGALLGVFCVRGDACICGGSHAPPPIPAQPSATAPAPGSAAPAAPPHAP